MRWDDVHLAADHPTVTICGAVANLIGQGPAKPMKCPAWPGSRRRALNVANKTDMTTQKIIEVLDA